MVEAQVRALVSGDAGFIGRNFTRRLLADGWDVDGFDIKTGTDARAWFPANDDRYDLLIHAAAVVGGRVSIDGDPLGIAGNMGVDHAALSWAVRTGTPVLYFSSSAAYPVGLQVARGRPLFEDDLHPQGTVAHPDQTYGWSKVTGEVMVDAARAAGAAVSVVRPFSGYGTDQDADYPFRAFVDRAVAREDPFTVWGTGEQVRDFIHIDDIYAACMAIVASGTTDPVNLATGIGTSFLDLARMVTAEAGYAPSIECLIDKPTGVQVRVGDPTRMRRYWEPRVTLLDGIRRALAGEP
jgi:nucleoside-diphosphate-sugar epimerase